MDRNELNNFYRDLVLKAQEIVNPLTKIHGGLRCKVGFYNGHYFKNENDNYQMEYYPIPVVEIRGICDIEVGIDMISVSTKLKKMDALSFDFSLLEKYTFEAYGIDNYCDDLYSPNMEENEFFEKIRLSDEKEIGFSFAFSELDGKNVEEFVKFLIMNKFYY